jgi:hypothetical protein
VRLVILMGGYRGKVGDLQVVVKRSKQVYDWW